MEKEFWLERWERKEIGFHEGVVNAYLKKYFHELGLARSARVFVPLCGKAVDMQWLREAGCGVVGVELSQLALQEFFAEQNVVPQILKRGNFDVYRADAIELYGGDFFELQSGNLLGVSAVYDRASMVALPPAMRQAYVNHMLQILPAGSKILLISFDYPQEQMAGPPFALSRDEVNRLYGERARIELLEEVDVLSLNPRFAQRGVTSLHERIYLIQLL